MSSPANPHTSTPATCSCHDGEYTARRSPPNPCSASAATTHDHAATAAHARNAITTSTTVTTNTTSCAESTSAAGAVAAIIASNRPAIVAARNARATQPLVSPITIRMGMPSPETISSVDDGSADRPPSMGAHSVSSVDGVCGIPLPGTNSPKRLNTNSSPPNPTPASSMSLLASRDRSPPSIGIPARRRSASSASHTPHTKSDRGMEDTSASHLVPTNRPHGSVVS